MQKSDSRWVQHQHKSTEEFYIRFIENLKIWKRFVKKTHNSMLLLPKPRTYCNKRTVCVKSAGAHDTKDSIKTFISHLCELQREPPSQLHKMSGIAYLFSHKKTITNSKFLLSTPEVFPTLKNTPTLRQEPAILRNQRQTYMCRQ